VPKKQTLKLPSRESIGAVLRAADMAPRANGESSRQLDAAVREVQTFFQSLLNPQASASGAGSASDTSQPAGRTPPS
jgi:hypothetical protein